MRLIAPAISATTMANCNAMADSLQRRHCHRGKAWHQLTQDQDIRLPPGTPRRDTDRRPDMAKSRPTGNGVRDYGVKTATSATGPPTRPTAKSARDCNTCSVKGIQNGSRGTAQPD